MKRYLVILMKKKYFFEYINDNNIYEIYHENNKVKMYLRKIFSKFKLPFLKCFFGEWKKKIGQVDSVIIMDNGYNKKITSYLKKKNKNIKIIFYFWNVINDRNVNALKDKNIDEFWTFDEQDAEKFNLKYFSQFYEKCFENESKSNFYKYDVLFLGAAKKREKIIKNIEKDLNEKRLNNKIIISHKGDKLFKYSEYLDLIKKSKSILEVVDNSQIGLTLRSLEALFYNKKLITNNKSIKKYDFYNKNNIFIIGEDNFEKINDFLNADLYEISEEIKIKYSYKNWINSLLK